MHKGCMFFTQFWILTSALNSVLLALSQLVRNQETLGSLAALSCTWSGETVKVVGIIVAMKHFGCGLFGYKFVRWNLGFLLFRLLAIWIAYWEGVITEAPTEASTGGPTHNRYLMDKGCVA